MVVRGGLKPGDDREMRARLRYEKEMFVLR